ncbi:MAG: secretin N-terminal domain-containing protein [Magnetococcales bacterium]|nr:secretin N-terminal domain-containing protein [Magnetococcales bacterium]
MKERSFPFSLLLLSAILPAVGGGCLLEKTAIDSRTEAPFQALRVELLDSVAINTLAESQAESARIEQITAAGLTVRRPERSATQGRSDPRFDVFVEQVEARLFFQGLVKDDDTINMVVHPQVKGKISLEVKGVTIDEVVEIACEMYHFECHAFQGGPGAGRGYKIFPWQLVTRTYRVDFLPVSRDGWSATSINSRGIESNEEKLESRSSATSSSNVQTRYDADFWSDLEDTLRSILNLDLVTTSVNETMGREGLQKRVIEKKPFDSQYETVVSQRQDELARQESDKRIRSYSNGGSVITHTEQGRQADAIRSWDDGGEDEQKRVRQQLKNLMVNRLSGLITVRAYPKDHQDISAFLAHLRSRSQRQVILEAKILEVILSDNTQLGIDWLAVNRGLGGGNRSPLSSEPEDGTTFTGSLTNPVVNASGDGVLYNSTALLKGVIFSKGAAGSPFGLAIRNHDFVSFISLLKQQGRVQILSSPRIATLNNQKAVIKVGEDEVFITGMKQGAVTASTAGTVGNTIALSVPIFEKMFTGISLDVTPQIGDQGEVTLHIHPLITEVNDKIKSFNINNQVQSIPLALSQTRETDSIIRVGNGEVAVIGGLMKKNILENEDKVPLLGDLPGLGGLFRQINKSSETSELVILIRPVIVDGNADWSADLIGTNRRIQRMGVGR